MHALEVNDTDDAQKIGWWYDWNVCYSGTCGSLFDDDREKVGDPAENGAVFVPMMYVLSVLQSHRSCWERDLTR